LLTDKEVAEQLQIKPRTVPKLGLPFVRIGAGKGVKRYKQEDVDEYINLRIQFGETSNENEKMEKAQRRGVSEKPKAVGVPVLLSRAQLRSIRMGNAGGSQGGSH
jgi:hypothetical protein